jgi:hypothetical protein
MAINSASTGTSNQAKAILNVNIFDDGPNLKITVTGSISGSPGTFKGITDCGTTGVLWGEFAPSSSRSVLCTGNDSFSNYYSISGPAGFGGNGNLTGASSVAGLSFFLVPSSYIFIPSFSSTYQLDNAYTLGQPFFSSATFNGRSLASEGFTATGLVGLGPLTAHQNPSMFVLALVPVLPIQLHRFLAPCPSSVPLPPSAGAAASAGASPLP